MLIQYKLQPHPNDDSCLKCKLRKGSFCRISAKETDDRHGKANFGRYRHSGTRTDGDETGESEKMNKVGDKILQSMPHRGEG